MKLKTTLILLIVAILTLTCVLTACNLFKSVSADDAKTNLDNAGYEVKVMTAEQYLASDGHDEFIFESELDKYIYAKKGDDEIYLFFFTSIKNASNNYDRMSSNFNDLKSGQSNELVYFGTKQAVKDAGL